MTTKAKPTYRALKECLKVAEEEHEILKAHVRRCKRLMAETGKKAALIKARIRKHYPEEGASNGTRYEMIFQAFLNGEDPKEIGRQHLLCGNGLSYVIKDAWRIIYPEHFEEYGGDIRNLKNFPPKQYYDSKFAETNTL